MADELLLPAAIVAEMLSEARRVAPLEACGLLGGLDGKVSVFIPLTNADASPEHFSMRPEEQFKAVKRMRSEGVRMLGIWHSHPASPARMSEEDLRLACTPDAVYVISSLVEGIDPAVAAFTVSDGRPSPVVVRVV